MATSEQTSVGIDVGSARITVASWPQDAVTELPCCIAAVPAPPQGDQDAAPTWATGAEALKRSIVLAPHTAHALPRLLACGHDDDIVAFESERLATGRAHNDRGDSLLHLGGQALWPEEALAELLRTGLSQLETGSAQKPQQAVLTIPAQFSRAQRQAMSHAARIAGLKVTQLVAAPVAIGIAKAEQWRLEAQGAQSVPQAAAEPHSDGEASADKAAEVAPQAALPQLVLSVDAGAGSLDVALLKITPETVVVLGLASASCGGDAIDDALVQAVASDFFDQHNLDVRQQALAHERLRQAVKRARERLAAADGGGAQAEEGAHEPLELPYIAADLEGTKHLSTKLTSQAVLAVSMDLIAAASKLCQQLLQTAELSANALAALWLSGGLQRTPGLAQAMEALGAPVTLVPKDMAARGAAVLAAVMGGVQPHPTLTLKDGAKAQAVPAGSKRGLTADELQGILDAHKARDAHNARLLALTALKQRAQATLANLSQTSQAELSAAGADETSDQDPDGGAQATGPLANLHGAMAAVAAALETEDPSHEAHEHLHARLQNLDIAAAQWQRASAHA